MAETGHRRVEGLTKLKEELNRLTLRELDCKFDEHYTASCPYCGGLHDRKRRDICRRWYRQELYASLLVRNSETIYVISPDHIPAPGQYQEITVLHLPNARAGSGDCVTLDMEKSIEPERLDTTKGVVRAVLEHWSQNDGHMAFKTHIGTQAALLRACHEDDLDHHSFRNIRFANEVLYVFLTSNDKMVARIEEGRGPTNFYTVLSASMDQFPAGAFEEEHTFLLFSMPNRRQIRFIKKLYRVLGWPETDADKISRQPLYDFAGRANFQSMLSGLLRNVYSALIEVKASIAETRRAGWIFPDEDVKLTGLLIDAWHMVGHLRDFANFFANILDIHLNWLSEVFDIEDLHSSISTEASSDLVADSDSVPDSGVEGEDQSVPECHGNIDEEIYSAARQAGIEACAEISQLGLRESPQMDGMRVSDTEMHPDSTPTHEPIDLVDGEPPVMSTDDESLVTALQTPTSSIDADRKNDIDPTEEGSIIDSDEHGQNCVDPFDHLATMATSSGSKRGEWVFEAEKYLQLICQHHFALSAIFWKWKPSKKKELQKVESRQIRESTLVVLDINSIISDEPSPTPNA